MKKQAILRTAESVSPLHPDKLCDRVSDAILDAYLQVDSQARVAVDVAGGHGKLFITGEVTANDSIDIKPIIERIVGPIELIENISQQSNEIARGVDSGGAGDQGIMIGYACDETPELLPLEYVLARSLNRFVFDRFPYDGKTQITLRGNFIDSIVVSFQNTKREQLTNLVEEWSRSQDVKMNGAQLFLNPAGDWSVGGFEADAGLTGRKLAVDNYGPRIPLGGGAFSGKDATKVDRSGAYMARRVAVDLLRKHAATEVVVRLAYAIGVSEPLEITALVDGEAQKVVGYELTPQGIIDYLELQKPVFEQTAAWGHFGHGFAWDR